MVANAKPPVVPDSASTGVRERKQVPLEFEQDLLERIDLYRAGQLNEKGKPMSRQALVMALLEDALRLRQGGGAMLAPAPVVVDVPNADEIAAAVVARLPVSLSVTPIVSEAPVAGTGSSRGVRSPVMDGLTMIYREVLIHREMTKDRIAERYVDHGASRVDGQDAAHQAYLVARGAADAEMEPGQSAATTVATTVATGADANSGRDDRGAAVR